MSFTPEAVLLEQRQGLGWRPLGQAHFASGGMKATLQALIDNSGAEAEDSATLLVIPDDQILYTSLSVPFGSDTPIAIGRALESMTPYRAEDLVFDWCPAINGDIETLRVAAVARRTLEEADEFARSQGFIPSGFIARPEDERFDGQPDFGGSLFLPEPSTRQPFSEPDLSLAGITAPTIPAAPDEPAQTAAAALTISRIPPHIPLTQPIPRPAIRLAPQATSPAATGATPIAVIEDDLPEDDLPMPVFRYDENGEVQAPGPVPHLSLRAQAFHARAQQARILREHPAEAEESTPSARVAPRAGFMPGPLGKVAAGLLLAIFLVMAFFGGTPETATTPIPDQTAQVPEPVEQDRAESPAAIDPVQPQQMPETGMPRQQALPEKTPETAPATTAPAATAEIPPATDDSLTRALAEAMAEPADRPEAPTRSISAATLSAEDLAAAPMGTPREGAAADGPAQTQPQTPAVATVPAALSRSARPPRAAPEKAATPAAPDSRPQVPGNPLPFDRRNQAEPNPVTGIRPPARPRSSSAEEATAPAAIRSPATRPQSRPQQLGFLEEGSRNEDDQPTRLSRSEEAEILQILRDLRTAQAGKQGLSKAERNAVMRLADARPTRKPVSVSGPSQQAVRDALAQAVEEDERPAARTNGAGRTALAQSARPASKPRGAAGKNSASLSQAAVENAIASAVSASTAMPGAVALTALTSSALPPRRAAAAIGNAVLAAAPTAPGAGDLRAAAQAQTAEREAALAEQRRIDSELQAQAEARARAFAAQDAAAEARARAQAEARARAQAEAEARTAAASKRNYTPPEAENEPEVATASVPDGRIATTAAATATVKDGIQISRTQIIGTIGAGKASRALVRLSNGKVITLRLGDKINGGTISEIGNSQISFVKGGRTQQLSVLSGQ